MKLSRKNQKTLTWVAIALVALLEFCSCGLCEWYWQFTYTLWFDLL